MHRRILILCATALIAVPSTQAATTAVLKKREHRQVMALHSRTSTLRFFRNHPHLVRGRMTRPIALREIRLARVWVAVLRRELAETRDALRPQIHAAVDSCLHELIRRESAWNVRATNPSTGAYGLPQALPGSKMASAGADWATNPATQIRWMLGYVRKYGGSCGALAFQRAHGWY